MTVSSTPKNSDGVTSILLSFYKHKRTALMMMMMMILLGALWNGSRRDNTSSSWMLAASSTTVEKPGDYHFCVIDPPPQVGSPVSKMHELGFLQVNYQCSGPNYDLYIQEFQQSLEQAPSTPNNDIEEDWMGRRHAPFPEILKERSPQYSREETKKFQESTAARSKYSYFGK